MIRHTSKRGHLRVTRPLAEAHDQTEPELAEESLEESKPKPPYPDPSKYMLPTHPQHHPKMSDAHLQQFIKSAQQMLKSYKGQPQEASWKRELANLQYEAGRRKKLRKSPSGPTIPARVGTLANQIKDEADSLKLSVKHDDDTQALHDFAMIVQATAAALKSFGWGDEARPMEGLGRKLMNAAKGQGIGDRY